MDETNSLNKKEIHTKSYIAVVRRERSRKGNSLESGGAWGSRVTGHLAFENCNVWAVDSVCATGVIWGDRTIADQVFGEHGIELCLAGAAELAIEFASGVGRFNLSGRKHFFLFGNGGNQGVSINGCTILTSCG